MWELLSLFYIWGDSPGWSERLNGHCSPLATSPPVRLTQSQDMSVVVHDLGQGFVLNLTPDPSHLRLSDCVLPFFQLCFRFRTAVLRFSPLSSSWIYPVTLYFMLSLHRVKRLQGDLICLKVSTTKVLQGQFCLLLNLSVTNQLGWHMPVIPTTRTEADAEGLWI